MTEQQANDAIHLWAMYERFGAPDEPTTATDCQQVTKQSTRKPVSLAADLGGSGATRKRRRHQGSTRACRGRLSGF